MKFQYIANHVIFIFTFQDFAYCMQKSYEYGLIDSSTKELTEFQVDWNDIFHSGNVFIH